MAPNRNPQQLSLARAAAARWHSWIAESIDPYPYGPVPTGILMCRLLLLCIWSCDTVGSSGHAVPPFSSRQFAVHVCSMITTQLLLATRGFMDYAPLVQVNRFLLILLSA